MMKTLGITKIRIPTYFTTAEEHIYVNDDESIDIRIIQQVEPRSRRII